MDIFLQQIINGLVLGSMYALVALGYTMVYGIINLINFAHGDVLMVGALTSWTVVVALGDSGLPGWLILLLSLLCRDRRAASILNFTIEKLAYRPLRNAPRLAPLITAMGMSLLLQTLAMIIWKPNPKPYPSLLPIEPYRDRRGGDQRHPVPDPGHHRGRAVGLMYLVNRTKLGRAMRATAENPRVAALMGVKPDMVISATFIIGAVAGRGGRRDVGRQLRHGAACDGLPARPEGIHRGSARRHRQPGRRGGRRRCCSGWSRRSAPAISVS